jgi:DNA polymerase sigma|tara:strand:+ start:125 stop:460 length:336 start_codon:yes stop_codon:yes gene_type:complete
MPRLIKPGWILKFRDTHLDLEVDIMVNKAAEVLHSNMILEYSRLDPRFKKLVQVLKKWNKNISSNINNRLNNYSIYLMLIAYMQSKKLLPNLQAMGKERKSIVQHQIQTEN